jgi:SAM-dependent methyltransferase
MAEPTCKTTADAVEQLRRDPEYADLIRDSYLGEDTREAAERFERSGEFAEVRRILGSRLQGAEVLDLGAGTGIASFALSRSGARRVYALEPDRSPVVGRGAIERLESELEILDGVGERIPLPDSSLDVVYSRQVLHHVEDLPALAHEVRRVLRAGGVYLACREHVVESDDEMEEFLANHAVHQLAGGESAYPLSAYLGALRQGGLRVRMVLGPFDSVINAFPLVRSQAELVEWRRKVVGPRLGRLRPSLAVRLPMVGDDVRSRVEPYLAPGAMRSFVARS